MGRRLRDIFFKLLAPFAFKTTVLAVLKLNQENFRLKAPNSLVPKVIQPTPKPVNASGYEIKTYHKPINKHLTTL